MQLVERHIIKPNHRFYREADRLSWLCKNLYNSANYIYRQNFFANQQTKALAVDRALKISHDYKALPAKVAQTNLGLALKAWTSYHLAVRNYQEDPTKFKAAPKIPYYQGSRERKRADGRYVVVFNCQAVSKRALKKGCARPSGTNIWLPSKVTSILEIRIVPKVGCYIVEFVYKKLEQPLQVNQTVAAIDLGSNNLATLIYNVAGRETVTRLLDKVAHICPIVGSFCLLLDFPYLLRCLILVTIRQCKQEIYVAIQIKECHATRI